MELAPNPFEATPRIPASAKSKSSATFPSGAIQELRREGKDGREGDRKGFAKDGFKPPRLPEAFLSMAFVPALKLKVYF